MSKSHKLIRLIVRFEIVSPIMNESNPIYLKKKYPRWVGHSSWDICLFLSQLQGAVSIRKTVLPGVAIPMLKIRRPNGRLIFNIGIAIPR